MRPADEGGDGLGSTTSLSTLDSRLTDKERALSDLGLRPDPDGCQLPDGWVFIETKNALGSTRQTVAVDPNLVGSSTHQLRFSAAHRTWMGLVDKLVHDKVLRAHEDYGRVLADIETAVREVLEKHGERT